MHNNAITPRLELVTCALFAAALLLTLHLDLLASLLAGLLVYALVHALVPLLRLPMVGHEGARLVAVTLIATAVIALVAAAGVGIVSFLRHSGESVPEIARTLGISVATVYRITKATASA